MEYAVINERLIPESEWAVPDPYLFEADERLRISLSGAIEYNGLTSIGGLVLGFRLIQRAVELAAGNLQVQRKGISVYTAFAGNGVRDAFEVIRRAVRDYRYCCDSSPLHPAAQPGPRGVFLVTIRVHQQSMVLAPT